MLVVPLAAPKGCHPFVPLSDPDLMIGISEIFFGEHFGFVWAIKHLADERKGEAILHNDSIEPAEVHHQPQLACLEGSGGWAGAGKRWHRSWK